MSHSIYNKLSGLQCMWIIAMFDLPTKTKDDRNRANNFRKFLISEGYMRLQLSVYATFAKSRAHAEPYLNHLDEMLPPAGNVRAIMITDKQFGQMKNFSGFFSVSDEDREAPPEQLLLF